MSVHQTYTEMGQTRSDGDIVSLRSQLLGRPATFLPTFAKVTRLGAGMSSGEKWRTGLPLFPDPTAPKSLKDLSDTWWCNRFVPTSAKGIRLGAGTLSDVKKRADCSPLTVPSAPSCEIEEHLKYLAIQSILPYICKQCALLGIGMSFRSERDVGLPIPRA